MGSNQLSGAVSFNATPGTTTNLMEVSAFMTEQLRSQMTEQRAHDNAQQAKLERHREDTEALRQEYEAKLERHREDTETLRREYEAKLERQREDTATRRQEYEAKLERQREVTEAQRQEYESKLRDCEAKLRDCESKLRDDQLERLQERFDALHQAKLLTDDEMFALEDKVADFIECRSSVAVAPQETDAVVDSVRKLVGMCEGVSKDGMFARQLRRKFL